LRPRSGPATIGVDGYTEQPVAAVRRESFLFGVVPFGCEFLGHSPSDPVLNVRLPRFAHRNEATAAIPEASLEQSPENGRAEITCRMRVAVLDDAYVVVRVTVLQGAQRLEEV
jgi:hypothetical protein